MPEAASLARDQDSAVVIFAALGWETGAVLSALADVRRAPLPGCSSWIGAAGGGRVRVVRTGVGLQRAQAAARRACLPGVGWFMATGCAGALSAGLEPGALVVATDVLDQRGHSVAPRAAAAAGSLQCWARRRDLRLNAGPFYSVARPLLAAADKRAAHETHGAIAVEMEGATIAAVAAAHGIDFVSLRAVLDPLDVSLPDLGGQGSAEAGLLGARALVERLLRQPMLMRHVGTLARLLACQRVARAALARFFRVFAAHGGLGVLDAVRTEAGTLG